MGKRQPLPSQNLFVLIIVSWCEDTFQLQPRSKLNSPGISILLRSRRQCCSYPWKGQTREFVVQMLQIELPKALWCCPASTKVPLKKVMRTFCQWEPPSHFSFFLLFLSSLPWVRKAPSLFNDSMCMFRSTQLRMMQSLYSRAFISVHSNNTRVAWLQLTACKNETLQV